MRTSNPALSDKVFTQIGPGDAGMTIQGTVNKSFVLIAIVMVMAFWTWGQLATPAEELIGYAASADPQAIMQQNIQNMMPWLIGAFVGSLIAALATIFAKKWAAITAPIYAVCEGVLMGSVSAFFEMMYPGIVAQAVMLTTGVFVVLLMVYKSGMIKVNDNFRLGIVATTGGVFLMYVIDMIMGFFGGGLSFLSINNSSMFSIGISLVIVGIAALNLVLDFDFIERASERGAPKYMEWYAAFGLLVTLVWLYIEILKLLAKLRGRD